jgi:predicted phosphodiesterase
MRYIVLTDIHANLEALDACLKDGAGRGYDRALILGDVVGYGPDPNGVVDRVRSLDTAALVRGNHDKIALGLNQAEGFHAAARAAARWTLESLTPANRAWLAALDEGPKMVDDLIEICHGAPFDEDCYIFDELDAMRALQTAKRPLCFYGHTHYAIVFQLAQAKLEIIRTGPTGEIGISIREGTKYLANPGSVGQPRDSNPNAAYAIVDTNTKHFDLYRVPYPVEITQQKMIEVGLPEPLARRLSLGR